ncbi:putative histone H3 lysine 36 methyltransferase protein [Botrytis fragariae]|uniref:Histone-lysine N-methyltransferase, H3 lysine-36 specific n=1 Tax=Botrytis fragariae TaxID=1964551 RepID=A0A8H6EJ13_9HELO|nr:putative histone H3 lysine 36 methyltransferase protein [Botrytis fragariae]KAF5873705.1 putative histone H3 lysine 36 methyltransferase protein [Botrytis fragariae]
MEDDIRELQPEAVDAAIGEMKIEEGIEVQDFANGLNGYISTPTEIKRSHSSTPGLVNSRSQTPPRKQSTSQTPKSGDGEDEEIIGGDITVTVEPGKAPKLSRKSSQKVIPRPPPLFNDLPDSTEEAASVFQVIKDCIYGAKHMGASDHDALDCDCPEEFSDGKNHACGEDSDCINRLTKMECGGGHKDCNCGVACQNQRFQRKQYAKVSVIKTDKKGYGLRANTDLHPDDFIFEYIGEVINEPTFRRRTVQYDQEGIKHFYFMSLTKHEFVDATKKGNLGRFCNHSCNPNCYVDKWVVGEKLRMGIFAERSIKAGEELVFNYNVDRYGADPQPCYCGEPNCTGFIGGKTQTERATKLPHATIEALGIDDGDGWDTAVAKKPRKKKTGEDDEEYVNNVQPKGLDENGVRKVMATLMQCKEKWIAVKLLGRIQRCDDDRVRNRVIQMHGYQILRTTLTTWKEDNNVILQVLDILYKFPRLTRNKIVDSKIEAVLEDFTTSEHEDIAFESKRLLEAWSKLEHAYRIPRRAPTLVAQVFERRPDQVEKVTPSPSPVIVAPTGPRSGVPQRNANFVPNRPMSRRPFVPMVLPPGWFTAMDQNGNAYYYSKTGQTTWERPFMPAGVSPPPPPPKAAPKSVQTQKALQDIIDSITKEPSTTPALSSHSAEGTPKEKKKPVEKWRSLPIEKQMKLYENTLFPHIKHVMQKYSGKLPKDDLKKFAKECGKKLVASDFKNHRIEDPTKISDRNQKKVKQFVFDYFKKAVEKKREMDEKRAERKKHEGQAKINGNGTSEKGTKRENANSIVSPDVIDDEDVEVNIPSPTASPSGQLEIELLKRKREDDEESPSESKRVKEDGTESATPTDSSTPPPPPPPPPAEGMPMTGPEDLEMANGEGEGEGEAKEETEEERELRMQEEDLMRENEEAMKMEMEVDTDGRLKGNNGCSQHINGANSGGEISTEG